MYFYIHCSDEESLDFLVRNLESRFGSILVRSSGKLRNCNSVLSKHSYMSHSALVTIIFKYNKEENCKTDYNKYAWLCRVLEEEDNPRHKRNNELIKAYYKLLNKK